MVQAHALLVAAALTVTVSPALAATQEETFREVGRRVDEINRMLIVDVPTCPQVREQAKQYTMKQIAAMAKRAGLTAEQWALVRECLKDKK